jgi:hypothetical protein
MLHAGSTAVGSEHIRLTTCASGNSAGDGLFSRPSALDACASLLATEPPKRPLPYRQSPVTRELRSVCG